MEHNLNIPTNFVSSAVHSTLQKANNIYADIIKAEQRIRKYLAPTPLVYSPYLSAKVNANLKSGSSNPCRVFLKLESENVTGSFKVRGAFNKVLISKEKGSALDFTTASTGNHAAAVVHVLQTFNYKGDIYIPYNAAKVKVTKLQQMIGSSSHISLIRFGDDCLQAELEARRQAQARNATYISPYNDYDVMVGQGTIGVEISAQLAQWSAKDNHGVSIPDYVIVPVGGGGLIGGITSFFKQQPKSQLAQSHTKIIGCQPANDNAMYQSVKAGRIVDIAAKETLSDATAGGIEREGNITFDICKNYVDDWVNVDESEISYGVYLMLLAHNKVVEGSAGCAIATLLKEAPRFEGKTVVLVICGANVGVDNLKKIIDAHYNPMEN